MDLLKVKHDNKFELTNYYSKEYIKYDIFLLLESNLLINNLTKVNSIYSVQ